LIVVYQPPVSLKGQVRHDKPRSTEQSYQALPCQNQGFVRHVIITLGDLETFQGVGQILDAEWLLGLSGSPSTLGGL
jgi:hypothetical protein